ncbi:unnamed protein product [Periconia digitata]|uniref:1,3-beta-glucanosyltransferase n=1 Tax=Periconia digitata TaxID=1303443 RepID=A0A9W4XPG9_9PLEO|nr:unnamed protein product [Periconia digitata]
MKLSVAAAATALLGLAAADLDPIVIKGSKFFYKTNGTQFFMKGVAYQQELSSNSSQSGDLNKKYVDPLISDTCKRDIPFLQKLNTNTIRVYAINPDESHDACMKALADAGIYVVADLSEPLLSVNRDTPEWNVDLYTRYTKVIDVMSKYTNTLGFFAGNEVSNQKNNTLASAFVKAAVRDSKAYIKAKNYRSIGVGYATNDDADIRENLANFFDCGDRAEAIDFWGYNIYSWCGDSSFTESGFDVRTKEFQNFDVPVFFAEYGCNTPRPRLFTEVGTLYGPEMTGVWSGGIVYMYFEEANQFGLATVDGNNVETNDDFNNLSSEIAKATPSAVQMSAYNPTNTQPAACPSVNSDWRAPASPLPPPVNAQLCACMSSSVSCSVADSVDEADYGTLFGVACGASGGKFCNGINRNVTAGSPSSSYGAYGMCSSKDQLNFALNAYYEGTGKKPDSCSFKGSATLRANVPTPTGECPSLLKQAGKDGNGTVPVGSAAAASGPSGAAGSASDGASGAVEVRVGLGLYVLAAVASGFAMVLL